MVTNNIRVLLTLLLCYVFLLFFTSNVYSESLNKKSNEYVNVYYDDGIEYLAVEVLKKYIGVKNSLEKRLSLSLPYRPNIYIVNSSSKLATGNKYIIAYALAKHRMIVIEHLKIKKRKLTVEPTLTHEVCHLVLGANINRALLPRWLDEGVCQYVSTDLSELLMDGGEKAFDKAVLTDRLFSMNSLHKRFPGKKDGMILAYRQSMSFIDYIIKKHGEAKLVKVLKLLSAGKGIEEAFEKVFSVSFYEFEKNWQGYVKRNISWPVYLSKDIYTLVFVFGAIITVLGFVMVLIKFVKYKDDENEDFQL